MRANGRGLVVMLGVVWLTLMPGIAVGAPVAPPSPGTGGRLEAYIRSLAAAPANEPARRLWHDGKVVALQDAPDIPIPSYSRQTKLPCSACHTTFPQLTSFGRLFKLNGYTLAGIEQIRAQLDTMGQPTLSLDLIPPVSVMAQASLSHVAEARPGTQNDNVELPDELSLFVGEAITPKMGTFLQFTYAGPDGSFGMDNADIRFADRTMFAREPLIFGLTLNNNPTVQDVWNTVPAWSFPFISSPVAPSPVAAPLIFGDLAQRVAGLGGYVFWNNLLYAEISGYRSAPQGGAHPADTTATSTLTGVAPYWRVALNKQIGPQSFEVGTYGIRVHQYPAGVSGPTDRFTDFGIDAQYEREAGRVLWTGHGTWVREQQALDATEPSTTTTSALKQLRTWKVDASAFVPARRLGATLGYFATSGTADETLFAPAPVDGSATGSPNSRGIIGELDFNPWLNTRFSAQYVRYAKFNGGNSDYDGSGRNARDNNTLYISAWLVF